MSVRGLDRLFEPRSIALLVGHGDASPAATAARRNLVAAGFAGPIEMVPVSPDGRMDRAIAAELIVVAETVDDVPALIDSLGASGARAVILLTVGEVTDPSMERAAREALCRAARPYRLRILGPDSLGAIHPASRLNASVAPTTPLPGDLALLTHSAAVAAATLAWAADRAIGFSHLVDLGEAADIDLADMMDLLAADPAVRAVVVHLDRLRNARKFMSAGRALSRTKPVVVLSVGPATGVADLIRDEAVRRAGMLRLGDMAELFDAVETLSGGRPGRIALGGDRLAVVTNGGGLGALALDVLRRGGGSVAPLVPETRAALAPVLSGRFGADTAIDLGPAASGARYAQALGLLAADPTVDAILIICGPTAFADRREVATHLAESVAAMPARRRRPILACWPGGEDEASVRRLFAGERIPVFATPSQAAHGFLHLLDHRRSQVEMMETPARLDVAEPDLARARAIVKEALDAGRNVLGDDEASGLLLAFGIDPRDLPQRTGFAITTDAEIGPAILFGPAPLVDFIREAPGDLSAGLPPLNASLARSMLERCAHGRRLLAEGLGPAATLIRLSELAARLPEIAALELDRLDGAVTTLIRLTGPGVSRPLAITPYPAELAGERRLRDGRIVHVRPIRPEDEPAIQDMIARSDPDDVRLRFFSPLKQLTHEVAARLTQIDYDREMAFVAEMASNATGILGVVRIAADPDRRTGEYGIMVRSDAKGVGLGWLLMTEMVAYARKAGIGRIVGEVLRENGAMLKMAEELGFERAMDPDDPSVVRVTLRLRDDAED